MICRSKVIFFNMVFGGHLGICKLQELPKVAVWATKLNLFCYPIRVLINQKSSWETTFLGSKKFYWTNIAS